MYLIRVAPCGSSLLTRKAFRMPVGYTQLRMSAFHLHHPVNLTPTLSHMAPATSTELFFARAPIGRVTITADQVENTRRRTKGSKISLVIFDKDGTLICFHSMWVPWVRELIRRLSTAVGLDLSAEVCSLLGFCPVQQRVKSGLLAEGTMAQIRQRLTHLVMTVNRGMAEGEAQQVVEENMPECNTHSLATLREIHDDTRLLFTQLRLAGVKMAMCTADNRRSTEATLRVLNLDSYIECLICGDDEGSIPKPHPRNALHICRTLGVPAEETMMVGDTLADVKMGLSAGLAASVGVLSGVANRSELKPFSDYLLADVGQMLGLVMSLNGELRRGSLSNLDLEDIRTTTRNKKQLLFL